jgi:hypothetical protein
VNAEKRWSDVFVLSEAGEPFAAVARRMNLVARVIVCQEWIAEGSHDEAFAVARDLEDELITALEQNEQERAA